MPKGQQKRFRVVLRPDFDQRKAWDRIQAQHDAVFGACIPEVVKQMAADLFPPDELMAEMVGWIKELAPDLSHAQFVHTLSRARKSVVGRGIEGASRGRRRCVFEMPLPAEEVVFSVTESVVRVPWLGSVRFVPNTKATMDWGVSAVKAAHLAASSFLLAEWSQERCLTIVRDGG